MLVGSPSGRLFFGKSKIINNLDPCVNVSIMLRYAGYSLFLVDIAEGKLKPKKKSCASQDCKNCKGYGLVPPEEVYQNITTLGIQPFRDKVEELNDYRNLERLFHYLVDIYDLPSLHESSFCYDCICNDECTLKGARRWCYPIKKKSSYVESPWFNPIPKSGLFPFLFLDNKSTEWVLCNLTTIKPQAGGIVQQGMRDRPRFFISRFKSSISIIKIPQICWDFGYQYAICRQFNLSTNLKPFLISPRIEEQFHFGDQFQQIKDNSDFLWRTRPLISFPFKASLKGPQSKKDIEVLPWDLESYAVIREKTDFYKRILLGCTKVFGFGYPIDIHSNSFMLDFPNSKVYINNMIFEKGAEIFFEI